MWPRPASPPRHGPLSPASAATGTATGTSTAIPLSPPSASTAMPRLPFSLRAPPSPPSSLPADAIPVFTGDVWVPAEPSYFSFGFGAKWAAATLTMWLARVVDDAAARPMLHLRLSDRAAVFVASGVQPEGPRQDAKRSVVVDAKAVEDVRRAVLYHTAAARASLSFYVDTDAARDHLVGLIREVLAASATSSPIRASSAASSPTRPPSGGIRPPSPETDAVALLERARAMHQRGHVVDALAAYTTADHALAQSSTTADADARARILHTRSEIRAAVEALEVERALPRAAQAATATSVDVSTPPTTASSTRVDPPAATIDARLEALQSFAHARDVDRAQRERRVAADDLSLRLHALRNDKPTAPSLETLQQRLERLRGGSATPPPAAAPAATSTASKLSPVDQIIQQALDEVALGIVDDDGLQGDDDGLSTGSSDRSSSSDDEEEDDQPARPVGRRRFGRRP